MEPVLMRYDPDTQVLRVRAVEEPGPAVAVPGPDMTILVSEDLDHLVGIDILDLPLFTKQYLADVPPATGQDLFEAIRPRLESLMSLLSRNLGPWAKDRVAQWDELVGRMLTRGE